MNNRFLLVSSLIGDGLRLNRSIYTGNALYVETAAISCLTARPSNDIVKLARQHLTRQWWEQRDRWDLFISQTVMEEIQDGNQEAAAKRVEKAVGLAILPITPDIFRISEKIRVAAQIPDEKTADAVHLALAAFHRMDFLATWNQKHLGNPVILEKVKEVIEGQGLKPAIVLTPENLLEMEDG